MESGREKVHLLWQITLKYKYSEIHCHPSESSVSMSARHKTSLANKKNKPQSGKEEITMTEFENMEAIELNLEDLDLATGGYTRSRRATT